MGQAFFCFLNGFMMRTHYGLIFFILMVCTALKLSAQEKPIEVKPYTLETTYEKLKKEYPFIKPIEALKTGDFKVLDDLAYERVNGRELKADIYMPTAKAEKYPAVLLVHGGGWISGSKANVRPLALQLANHGYVAVTVEYRLSTEAVYPAAVKDLKAAIRWMRDQAEVFKIDKNRIAILGNSAGAQLATLVGVTGNSELYKDPQDTTSDAVQAIINVDGIVSFTHPESEEGEVAAQWLNGSRSENLKNWEEASPLTYINAKTPPTLFINSTQPRFHAGRDDMLQILNQHDIYNEVHTLPGTPHSFWLVQPWFDKTLQYSLSFLDRVFNTESSEIYKTLTVAQDGSGDHKSIQEAISNTRDLGPGFVKILIKEGVYNEKIVIPAWKRKIALIGMSGEEVVLVNFDYSGKLDSLSNKEHNTFTSYTLKVEGQDFYAENLTIQNTWCEKGQAVALHVAADRAVFKNCKILGCQDTVYTAGEGNRILFDSCYIEGTTDFIFGQATAFFDACEIHSLSNSYVTAASTPKFQEYGYVLKQCTLTAAQGVDQVYLGRPWRPYAKTVFIESKLGDHIVPEGWNVWDGDAMFPHKERTVFYAEFQSTGAGANPDARVWWSHQLYEEEALQYTKEKVLGGKDHWDPDKQISILK